MDTRTDLLCAATRAFLQRPKRMLIDGQWCAAADGAVITTEDPATETTLAEVPAGGAADVEAAVQAARKAFEQGPWHAMRPSDRERLLLRLADLVEANAEELAQIEAMDNGKPATMARAIDVAGAAGFLRYMAGWATKLHGENLDVSVPLVREREFVAFTRQEAVGVVGAIIPWNFPLLMAAWKLGPALACGCTVVLKPAEETPLSALRLGELVVEAGYPAGVVNIVTGDGARCGAALAGHPDVDKIAFTGSTEVGKLVGGMAMERLARVTLELGGKSPVIMLDDISPEAAAAGAAQAIFFNQGQVCTAGSRLYLPRARFDATVQALADIANSLRLGPGLEPDTGMGPLVSRRQRKRVAGYVQAGVDAGAQLVCGGGADLPRGHFFRPTVLAQAPETSSVVQEEIFGPVVVALPYDDIDEVVGRANGTPFGLAASVWSNDLSRVHRLVPRIKAGTVWVNCHNVLDNAMPFGGFKQSGLGREMGRAVFDHYTETKSVMIAV
ncbi:aldehyde dehydrogenase family protein [Cupriavidus sp. WKF15]|uniref:aldehyde dehydrogenase family protein n=1 Tax=Cupriavidus sp. WKF15 TaxID=3032282 RepID=UPI0023E35089|nr:aldehyde dehydrogenase family protein [Cupriavidus sp. WKF15]WER48422.1 aldehyde dehydrogenase family protein [Cupriavidus sp. WKF15]